MLPVSGRPRYVAACLAGDGIGPEVMAEASRALAEVSALHGFRVDEVHPPFAGEAVTRAGHPLPPSTRQATRGRNRNYDRLWRIKAAQDGRLRTERASAKSSLHARSTRIAAVEAWMQVGRALAASGDQADRDLARSIATFIREMPTPVAVPSRAPEVTASKPIDIGPRR